MGYGTGGAKKNVSLGVGGHIGYYWADSIFVRTGFNIERYLSNEEELADGEIKEHPAYTAWNIPLHFGFNPINIRGLLFNEIGPILYVAANLRKADDLDLGFGVGFAPLSPWPGLTVFDVSALLYPAYFDTGIGVGFQVDMNLISYNAKLLDL